MSTPTVTIDRFYIEWKADPDSNAIAKSCEAVVEVSYPINDRGDRRLQTFRSGGLYGIERPSPDYRRQVEKEETEDLRAHLAAFGITLPTDLNALRDGPTYACDVCGWKGHLSRHSIKCPICFRKLRETVETKG